MKTFEKLMQRIQQRQNKPVHTVVQYRYTMEDSRAYVLDIVQKGKTLSFERIFEVCENRLHAIFMFLSMLELVQAKYMNILIGEGRNNFIVEFNENRTEEDDSFFPAEKEGDDMEPAGPQSALGLFDTPVNDQPELRFDEDGSGESDQGDGDDEPGEEDDRALLN
jgi:chromatin segregation and condensation protein Rec8/ScpA/Scc1 (kleisin family)